MAELLKWNLTSQVVELFRRLRTMLKILYFSGDHQFFQKLRRVKFLYDRGTELYHLLAGQALFETGEALSAKLSTEKATGAHLTGALAQGVLSASKIYQTCMYDQINEYLNQLFKIAM